MKNKTLIIVILNIVFATVLIGLAQSSNDVPANIKSALVWDDPDASRTDSTGFRVEFINGGLTNKVTTLTNRLDLLGAMAGKSNGVYTVTVIKLCGTLESEPSTPLRFSWNDGVPAAPTKTKITTTVTLP